MPKLKSIAEKPVDLNDLALAVRVFEALSETVRARMGQSIWQSAEGTLGQSLEDKELDLYRVLVHRLTCEWARPRLAVDMKVDSSKFDEALKNLNQFFEEGSAARMEAVKEIKSELQETRVFNAIKELQHLKTTYCPSFPMEHGIIRVINMLQGVPTILKEGPKA